MVDRNLARCSSVISPPMKEVDSAVSGLNTGLMQLTRILSGPSSTAIDLLVPITADLLPLYQVRPGRGRTPAVDAMLMKTPPPWRRNTGVAWMADRYTLLTLTA